ncbi:MAG: alanine racemase [Clostridiaceae bacterium]|nr:alanine racemase [Clostridiaceae bacterium]
MNFNSIDFKKQRSWCELSGEALRHNINQISMNLPPATQIMAVIKADAYGHGAIWVAEQALEAGCTYLAVAAVEEALKLREAEIAAPILILSPYREGMVKTLIEHNLTQTVASEFDSQILLNDLNSYLVKNKLTRLTSPIKIHIKIDSGMNRIGFSVREKISSELVNSVIKLFENDNLELEGIFTHFAVADEPQKDFTQIQFDRFQKAIKKLETKNIVFQIQHCSNSVAAIFSPEVALSYVRLGIAMYGWCPNSEIKEKLQLKPVMSFFSKISGVHQTSVNETVGYGQTYTTQRQTLIGTIEAGYGDGLDRHLSNTGTVLINGHTVPIIGRVCMDRTMLDLTDLPQTTIGDEVLIFGQDHNGFYRDLDDLAEQAGTISYEILCGITKRIPKIIID